MLHHRLPAVVRAPIEAEKAKGLGFSMDELDGGAKERLMFSELVHAKTRCALAECDDLIDGPAEDLNACDF